MKTFDVSGLSETAIEVLDARDAYMPIPYAVASMLVDFSEGNVLRLEDGTEVSPLEMLDVVREILCHYVLQEYVNTKQ